MGAQESNEEWNEWLLIDRMGIIKDVIVAHSRSVVIKSTASPIRDLVLYDMLKKAGALNLESDSEPIEVSSIIATKKEANNPVCSVFDKTHSVIKLYPLKVCSEEWINWYFNKKIRKIKK